MNIITHILLKIDHYLSKYEIAIRMMIMAEGWCPSPSFQISLFQEICGSKWEVFAFLHLIQILSNQDLHSKSVCLPICPILEKHLKYLPKLSRKLDFICSIYFSWSRTLKRKVISYIHYNSLFKSRIANTLLWFLGLSRGA